MPASTPSYKLPVLALLIAALCFLVPDALAQSKDIGAIMKDNVAESSRGFGQGWITLISVIGWIMAPIGLIGTVSAAKERGDFKGPVAMLVIGSLCLAMVYIPGIITQTVVRKDAEGLDDLGVD